MTNSSNNDSCSDADVTTLKPPIILFVRNGKVYREPKKPKNKIGYLLNIKRLLCLNSAPNI